MRQRTINSVCLLLAAAGISFGVGQSVGQERASADAKPARIQFVRDTAVRYQVSGMRHELFQVGVNIYALCKALVPEGTTANGCVFP
jgi:hypothetical protein